MTTQVELVTPERILFSGEADFVVLRTDGGEVMFLPHHAPFTGAAAVSLLRIARPAREQEEHEELRAAVHGGFVQVVNNRVTVLASVAELGGEIDVDRARRALRAAEAQLSGGESSEPTVAGGALQGAGEEVERSAALKAMLFPDDPEVASSRARARLEAAGASEAATAS